MVESERRWLVVLDCDKTMWDHPDATSLNPPFSKLSDDEIIDSSSDRVRLNRGLLRFLRYLKLKGHLIAIASWNEPYNVIELLKLFNLKEYFDEIVVEPHPNKDIMIEKILKKLKARPQNVIFIDDNPVMHRLVKKKFPSVISVEYSKDLKDFEEALNYFSNILGTPPKAYISFSDLHTQSTDFIKRYIEIVRECGLNTLPESNLTNNNLHELLPNEFFRKHLQMLDNADLLIADVSSPSHKVGMEIMYAYMKNKKIFVTCSRDSKVSSMIRGMPRIHIVKYDTISELKNALWKELHKSLRLSEFPDTA